MEKKFIVRPKSADKKDDTSVTMTIRINKELQKEYDKLAEKSHRSRNELISMALCYALENLEFIPEEENQ
ncbi:CopG family transcriptional regulator [Clostridium sp. D33t1_170424_F3]|uniref:CopG family transcriptional regulator n=1 Tax=Clostridium sp. D33t1_170424_F3 TaxID=2787099 RepID=UPI0018AADB9F|nr:CopG family transcriptional regulator [Clostridium sp. D33t1_170424_F3]